MRHRLERELVIGRSRDEIFPFFAEARNLERITPGFLHFKILTEGPIGKRAGTRIDYQIRLNGIPMRWQTLIEEFVGNEYFVDAQVKGPYKLWRHRHSFSDVAQGTLMRDEVEYELPFGIMGELAHGVFVRRQVEEIFRHRNQVIAELFK